MTDPTTTSTKRDRKVWLAVAAVALGVLAAGCGSPEPAPAPQETSSPTVAVSKLPTGWTDADGEGDLSSMSLSIQDNGLITVQAEGPTPQTGTVLYSVLLDGYQVGLKSIDGDVTVFVFDSETSQQTNLTNSFLYSDGAVAFRIPSSEVPNLEAPFEWVGTLSVDGEDVSSTDATEFPGAS